MATFIEEKALKQVIPLLVKNGAFAPLLKSFLEQALEAEMEEHLKETQRVAGNNRNPKGAKTIKSGLGTFRIQSSQNRKSTLGPTIVCKRESILADTLEKKIIRLYGIGISYQDSAKHIKEMYDTDVSIRVLTQITDRIIPTIKD